MSEHIYLDNSATTKIRDEALKKYCEVSQTDFGNPSSLHGMGLLAEQHVNRARSIILDTLGLGASKGAEVVFTASGSEANNLAILGHAMAKERYKRGAKIITTLGEHASVDEPFEKLKKEGFTVAYIPTAGGEIDLEALEKELTENVILVSSMMVNNETGAVYNLPCVAKMMKTKCPDALFHVDATQGYMKIPFSMASIGADMITLSSHKIEGPKGVGALVLAERVIKTKGLSPIVYGGGQGAGLRSGTENVPGIAAFAEAARLAQEELRDSIKHMEALRGYLAERISTEPELKEITPTLPPLHAPHILNITLPFIKSETMLHFLSSFGIYISSGSACSSHGGASKALSAYGHTKMDADCSVRISFSRHNTKADVDRLCDGLKDGLATLSRIK